MEEPLYPLYSTLIIVVKVPERYFKILSSIIKTNPFVAESFYDAAAPRRANAQRSVTIIEFRWYLLNFLHVMRRYLSCSIFVLVPRTVLKRDGLFRKCAM